jgi:putative endonuclease
LVRAPACHAGSCEFESRPDRQVPAAKNAAFLLIMWFVYILYSNSIDRYYIGISDNLEWRLKRHNQGWGRYTKYGIPWKIVHIESFDTKSEDLIREKDIKRKKSRDYIENLIKE